MAGMGQLSADRAIGGRVPGRVTVLEVLAAMGRRRRRAGVEMDMRLDDDALPRQGDQRGEGEEARG